MDDAANGRIDGTMLPEQHEDQLQLGFRIIQNSFKNKVTVLEQELKGLRLANEEQKNQCTALQRKNSALEVELVESHQRAQQLAEENKELFKTVQQLRKRVTVLEDLKKKVYSSIQDEAAATSTDGDSHKLYLNDDYMAGAMPLTMAAVRSDVPGMGMPQSYQSPMPVASPPPMTQSFGGPPSPAAPAAPAPSGANQPMIDGKQFFRVARSQLSYEAFNEFLSNIKKLNNQQQTREETLEEARRIFGPGLAHLYADFEQLLNRHAV